MKASAAKITRNELGSSNKFKKRESGNALVPVHCALSQHPPRSGSRAETPKCIDAEKALRRGIVEEGNSLPDKRVSNRA